jgi:choline dehydrogenase-like flavoprotein
MTHQAVNDAGQWVTNIGSERYWQFEAEPNPHLNGRAIPIGMGKVLGGGSSINAMIWARGHKSDWDFFASETGDPGWGYESVLNTYRRIEDWQGGTRSKISRNRRTDICPAIAGSKPCRWSLVRDNSLSWDSDL